MVSSHLYNHDHGACQKHGKPDELPNTTSIFLPQTREEGTVDSRGEPKHAGRKTDTDSLLYTTRGCSHSFH